MSYVDKLVKKSTIDGKCNINDSHSILDWNQVKSNYTDS